MEYTPLTKIFYSDKEHYEEIYHMRYNDRAAVHLNFEIHGYPAFFLKEPSFVDMSIELYRTDKKVRKLYEELPKKALNQFAVKCLIDEIILTNDIEGVYSTRREIYGLLTELKEKANKKNRFYGLVHKYMILQSGESLSFKTCQDIRNLYNDLVYAEIEQDDPNNLPDGILFRRDSASVMSETQKEIHRGVNPESKIIQNMEEAISILHDTDIEVVFRIAVFHYLFGYIHPFYDGNGRISRFISSYLLAKEFEPIFGYRLSYSVKENVREYYKAFRECNEYFNRGDLTPFISMFFNVMLNAIHQLVEALEKRSSLLKYYAEKIKSLPFGSSHKYNSLYYVLIQASLFSEYGISTQDLLNTLEISRQTLKNRLMDIEPFELVIVDSNNKRNNYYRLDLDKLEALSNSQ